MKNIFEAAISAEIVARINQLTPDTERVWGTMTPAQMLAHCNVTYEMVYEDKHPKPNAFVKFLLKLFVKGKVELNYRKAKELKEKPDLTADDDDYDFAASKFSLLADVREQQCKGIELSLELSDINETLISDLAEVLNENPGNLALTFNIHSHEHDSNVNLFSRKYKVKSDNDFLNLLNELPEVKFKVSV